MSSDPPRLLEAETDGFERALLDSAKLDVGSDQVRAACLVAMATSCAVVGTASAAPAAGAGLKGATALFGKWLAVGATVGAVTAGTVAVVVPADEPAVPAVAPPAEVRPQPEAKAAPARPQVAVAVAPSASAEPPAPVTRASADSGESRLGEELRLLDEARVALRAGRPRGALAALDARDREHPRGELGPEGTVLRVQALLQAGDRAGARRVAEGWLRRRPTGPHAERIRGLLGESIP